MRNSERLSNGSLTLKLSFWNHDVCRRSYSNALTNVDRKIRNMNVALCKTLLELGSFIDFCSCQIPFFYLFLSLQGKLKDFGVHVRGNLMCWNE